MSTSIGSELPERVFEFLSGSDGRRRIGAVVPLVTTNECGSPHASLLSPGEILAVSNSEVRLALYREGMTLKNVAARGHVALVVVEAALVCYVNGSGSVTDVDIPPSPLQPFHAVRVDVKLTDVRLDSESGASIVTGARYRRDASTEEELAYWHGVWSVLRAA